MNSLRDYLQFIIDCDSVAALWQEHMQQMAAYGFDRTLYGYTRYKTGTALGPEEDMIVLSNLGQEYMDVFFGQGLYKHGPMIKWALNNDGVASWGMVAGLAGRNALTEQEKEAFAFNQKMGVSAGYTISFKPVSKRGKGAVSLIMSKDANQADADRIWAQHGKDLVLLNEYAHLKLLSLPNHSAARALTERQCEVLEWVGDGKTTRDISVVMGLTVPTVEKHLRLAREALGVETTAQAVLKASFSNQIFILPRK